MKSLRLARLVRATRPQPAPICQSCPSRLLLRSYISTRPRFAEVQSGPIISQSNRAEITLRRFWKSAHVAEEADGTFRIKLDHRDLKAPSGKILVLPKGKRLFATLIAAEWDNQAEAMKPTSLALTSLAFRAIDGFNDPASRCKVVDKLMQYLETDTILYHDDGTGAPTLESMQRHHWDPLLQWVTESFGIELSLATGFSPAKQSPPVLERLRQEIDKMDHWQLAAFERATYASKSFIIGLALCSGRLTADQASDASHVEVRSQIERWGEVEDSHDVDYQDIRKMLGSVAISLIE
ncbi:hypothetical protein BD324DRAFT_612582 [Kockovaella imperatae]|uniref:ATP12-domain-containing protein n=1 Tax=Kockovaella imperatae TaxID=4999 RepID=A0A1Y1USD3_9TREE|nr:hypothetical protein BD324DRAFT_612582 [Kockovaella imperatae]ORX40931.1 hypothetical protein BD324DRAFT_612582 [Kockovaella imperatae]